MSSIIARLLLLVASATPALSFCSAHTHLDRRQEGAVEVNEFGYAGTIGPLLWTSLDPEVNSACSTGTRQSPIDMVAEHFNMMPGNSIGLTLPDVPEGAEFENLGTTVEVVMAGLGGRLTMPDSTVYNLSQFHFHHPSEHIDNGVIMPMEMHMVFQSEANDIAVIGMYIDIGCAPSSLLETVFASVEDIAEPGSHTTTAPLIMSEVVDTLTAGKFQAYSGSLTTPPCSEGVSWLVSTQKLAISTSTFINARNVLGFNSRYPQNAPGQPNLLQLASQT